MADIKLSFDSNTLDFDIDITGDDINKDSTLKTAVLISLFTDKRAASDDILPHENSGLRGWWGDNTSSDQIGSKLWLLEREKITQDVLNRAKEYAEESLQWLIEDGVATKVEVETEVIEQGILGIGVKIHRTDGKQIELAFNDVWENM